MAGRKDREDNAQGQRSCCGMFLFGAGCRFEYAQTIPFHLLVLIWTGR